MLYDAVSPLVMRRLLFIFFLLLLSLTSAFAQQSFPVAQVKADARAGKSTQTTPAAQARLQQWFLAKISFYQHCLDDTALGKANPRVIDLGNFNGGYKRLLAAPSGTGACRILFGNVGDPSTLDDITFPQAASDAYIDGHPDTCWHEFQHVIVIASEKAGRPVAVPLKPWEPWRKTPTDEFAEHIYIESLGEYTVEWLDILLHERSALTNGPGMAFEKYAREAWTTLHAYQQRSENITYAVEYAAWAKAHEAWVRAWKENGRLIAPLPASLRQDYQQICGVRIPFVEEIVKYYMQGGLTMPNGTKILVPEWVMWPDTMQSGIIIGHLNPKQAIANDTLRYTFDVRILESYRFRERSASLDHGKLTVTMQNADADTRIETSVDGKPVTGPIDLSKIQKNSTVQLTLVHTNLAKFVGVKRYSILVDYADDPRVVNGVKLPSFYYPGKAIYYIDVTGKGAAAKQPTGGKPAAKTPATGATTTGAGRWVLKNARNEHAVYEHMRNQPYFTLTPVSTTTSADFTTQYHDARQPKDDYTAVSHHAWNALGETLFPGKSVSMTITVTGQLTSAKAPKGQPGTAQTSLSAFVDSQSGVSRDINLSSTGGGTVTAKITPESDTQKDTITIPVPNGKIGDTFTVRLDSSGTTMTASATFEYTFELGGPATTENAAVTATLTAEEPPASQLPPQLDNDPPRPGDVVKIPKTTKPTTPPKAPRRKFTQVNWYVHPSGDYRFILPKGWRIDAKHFFDEANTDFDTLWPQDEGMAVLCSRGVNRHDTQTADAVLKEFANKQTKNNPGATSERITLGAAQGVRVTAFDAKEQVITWHIALFYQQRSYYLAISMPADKVVAVPTAVTEMLKTLVMHP